MKKNIYEIKVKIGDCFHKYKVNAISIDDAINKVNAYDSAGSDAFSEIRQAYPSVKITMISTVTSSGTRKTVFKFSNYPKDDKWKKFLKYIYRKYTKSEYFRNSEEFYVFPEELSIYE